MNSWGNFKLWKLNTAGDYAYFFAVLLAGFLFFWHWSRRIARGRCDESATKRVERKLSRLARKGRVLSAAQCGLSGADLLLLCPGGAYAIRCIGWGMKIYGSLSSPAWRLESSGESRSIPNPLDQLAPAVKELRRWLNAAGMNSVPVEPLVVFADPFDEPRLFLEKGARAVTWSGLKKWYRQLPTDACSAEKLIDLMVGGENKK
ncbi:MAG: nuclease-related domain-containing protein [Pyramidobacter sp.]|jgi:hypothetical protein